VAFTFTDQIRPGAEAAIAGLTLQGKRIKLVSGDTEAAVRAFAARVGIADWVAGALPAEKAAIVRGLGDQGYKVLMVGDGLNDAPALAAAHVSLSPISASHLAQAHADAVFLGDRLAPVAAALMLARKARSLMLQNLWLSVAYNAIAVPIAISGHATPLVAALAMSGSSILVTLNALRARGARGLES
jgi:Cu2+-exporting ATPase